MGERMGVLDMHVHNGIHLYEVGPMESKGNESL